MRSDIAIGKGAEDRIAQRMQPDIAIRMRGKAAIMRDINPAKAHRPVAITEFVDVIAIAGADIKGGQGSWHGWVSLGMRQGRQHGKIRRLSQLHQAFITWHRVDPRAAILEQAYVIADLGIGRQAFMPRGKRGKPEHLRCLGAAKTHPVDGVGHPVILDQLHRIDDRQNRQGGVSTIIKGGNQLGNDALRQEGPRRIVNGDKADSRARCRGKAGRHRILAPRPTCDNHHAVITGKIANRRRGLCLTVGGGNDDNTRCCRVVDEGGERMGEDTTPAQAAELLFQAVTHARASAAGNDNGGKPAQWRICAGPGCHDPVITKGSGKVYDNSGRDSRCDSRCERRRAVVRPSRSRCDASGHAKGLEVLP